jgi:hypothetical protein
VTANLRLACLDAEAPPLFSRWSAENGRQGENAKHDGKQDNGKEGDRGRKRE